MKTFIEILKEDPDKFNLSNGNFKAWHIGGLSFGYFGNIMVALKEPGLKHSQLIRYLPKKAYTVDNLKKYIKQAENHKNALIKYDIWEDLLILKHDDLETISDQKYPTKNMIELGRFGLQYSGRVWPKDKVISFWDYPKSFKEWSKIKKDINKAIGINITDDWHIDLSTNSNDKSSITVKDYEKSNEVKKVKQDLSKIHVMSPIQKRQLLKKVKSGFGSSKQADVARKAGFKSYAEYRALTRQEQKDFISFSNWLNEKFLDGDNYYPIHGKNHIYIEIFINPSTKEVIKSARGIIDPNGNLYVVNTSYVLHSDIVRHLINKGHIKVPSFNERSLFDKYKNNFLGVQRHGNTKDFFVSASYDLDFYHSQSDVIEKYLSKVKKKNPLFNFIGKRIKPIM
jgi:hypothetical protein